jgi:hypothetical protein
MTNKDKYKFDDFTLENYKRLLYIALQKGFIFSDYDLDSGMDRKEIVWRHDVEFSLHRAYKIAVIEKELGIKAHYFFHLNNQYYNMMEKEVFLLVRKIVALGHYCGLHFDTHFWGIRNEDHLTECLLRDKRILEDYFLMEIRSFSFHNTNPNLLSLDALYYAGMLNVYSKAVRDKYRYCTDSTGIWRYERLEDVLLDNSIQYLQVLTHDGMWQDEALSPRQRVLRCIEMRAMRRIEYYDTKLPLKGQLNIDD